MPKNEETTDKVQKNSISFEEFKTIVLKDYRIACESRETSILGRKEVLQGKAKFGIFGDGKEIAQLAMAKVFKPGDFRAGYYRDQTFMFATGLLTVQQWFAELYANTDIKEEPSSAGRQMNAHFSTHTVTKDGDWTNLAALMNSSSDVSPTGSQMPRLLGLAHASKLYRNNPGLYITENEKFTSQGNEIAFGTIGDASTSEGIFFETLNAAGVLQVPMLLSVWDDGYGISVPKKYQTVKSNIYEALLGMQRNKKTPGIELFQAKGWDFPVLCEIYEKAAYTCRTEHVPVLIHVDECTQPLGHSTSGSHERYKSPERLLWEKEFDGIKKMREWMLKHAISTEEELASIEEKVSADVKEARDKAWKEYLEPIKNELREVSTLLRSYVNDNPIHTILNQFANDLDGLKEPLRRDIVTALKKSLRILRNDDSQLRQVIVEWNKKYKEKNADRYDSCLYTNEIFSVTPESVVFDLPEKIVNGHEILRDNFDAILARYPNVVIFGEDSGHLGDVNQGLENLQKKYGELRVFDCGIREATIVGQAIGMAMRGLRPIAEIQYLDYLIYALQILSDDLATVAYRTKGTQRSPVIIRTRGHRLEGIWHSGSPMGMIINSLRGIYICVPRNMTQAAGFYNTILSSNEPALIIEPLNSYRLKEKRPSNFGQFKVPLGIPEILLEGTDVTIVTYGPLCRMALDSAKELSEFNISCEVIDVQTLLPFDINKIILISLQKTNRILFLDEDVPGGASAFMMQKVLEEQGGFNFLDSPAKTLTAKEHRPAYGSDGDYFSKPSTDDIFEAVYSIMHEANPNKYPELYE